MIKGQYDYEIPISHTEIINNVLKSKEFKHS